jgi:hypothetical protein
MAPLVSRRRVYAHTCARAPYSGGHATHTVGASSPAPPPPPRASRIVGVAWRTHQVDGALPRPIARIWPGARLQQQRHGRQAAVPRGGVQRGVAVSFDVVHVRAGVQQRCKSVHVVKVRCTRQGRLACVVCAIDACASTQQHRHRGHAARDGGTDQGRVIVRVLERVRICAGGEQPLNLLVRPALRCIMQLLVERRQHVVIHPGETPRWGEMGDLNSQGAVDTADATRSCTRARPCQHRLICTPKRAASSFRPPPGRNCTCEWGGGGRNAPAGCAPQSPVGPSAVVLRAGPAALQA